MSTFCDAFKVAQVSVEKQKNFPLSCYLIFNTNKTSFIFHLYHGSKAILMKDELSLMFLELLVELMTAN